VNGVVARLRLAATDVRGVQKGGPIQADVDEGRLHARQHPAHLAAEYIAHQATAGAALYDDLLEHPVLDQRHPGLRRRYVNQQLFTHPL